MNDFDTSMQEQIEDENSAGRQFFLETVKFIAQSSQHQNLEPTDAHDWITEKTNEDAAAQFLSLENIQCITNPNSNDESGSSTNFGSDGLKVSWKDAKNAMNTFIKFFEQTPGCTSDDSMTAYRLEKILRTRKLNNLRVKKLRDALKSRIES